MGCGLAIAGIAAAAVSAGTAGYAASQQPGSPAQPNYGTATRQTLKAQIDLAPQLFASEANPNYGQPAYTALQLENLKKLINGTNGNDGLSALLSGEQSKARAGDITDVTNLGPAATAAKLAADPYSQMLLAKLNAQAGEGLDAGSMLTADEQRVMQQNSRAASAARGMGGGNGAIADELSKQFAFGQQLLRQRQQFAQGLIGVNQGVAGDPFQEVLGRTAGSALPSATAALSSAGPSLFNPQAGLGLASSNYATAAQIAAAKPSAATTTSGILGGIGQFAGSFGSAY